MVPKPTLGTDVNRCIVTDVDLRISLKKLEVLSLVVQLGGVGRAAEHLFVSQPVVTAHIRSVEERLGTKLFYREGHTMHLTEAGTVVLAWAEDVLTRSRELDRALTGMVDGTQGTVSLGASMSVGCYMLPPILSAFKKTNPKVDLRLSISDTEHAISDSLSGELDFAVVVHDDRNAFPGMEVEDAGEDEIVLIGSPASDHPASISLDDLADLKFVDAPQGIVRRAFVDRYLRELGVADRDVVLELGHPEAMKRAAREGVGLAFLFRRAVASELAKGSLVEIEVEGADLVFPIFVIYRKGKTISPLHRNLLAAIEASLSSSPDLTVT